MGTSFHEASLDQADSAAVLLAQAVTMAAKLHASQRRKLSGAPYLGHLLRVCGLVLEYGGTVNEAVAALLHDAVEDQGGLATWEAIRQEFGEAVASLVLAVSDATEVPKPPWQERKERFIAQLKQASLPVRRLVLCDKIDNLRSLLAEYRVFGEKVWEKFRGGREGTMWYFREILRVLEESSGDDRFAAGLQEYRLLVDELVRLAGRSS